MIGYTHEQERGMEGRGMLTARGVSHLVDDQVLLAPISLDARPGRCLALLGENGSGKTTLLRILGGRMRPSDGEVKLDGRVMDDRTAYVRRKVSSLVGSPAFYRDLTLFEHLLLINATWGISRNESVQLSEAVLERFMIAQLRARFPHELSSGQTQMFHLAATFVRPFAFLILDEPEQRLDPRRKKILGDAMIEAKACGSAVVFASHDAELVERVADERLDLSP